MANILIVEDDKAINQLMMRNLTLVGYTCVQVYSGDKVMEALSKESFDLIILDVMLPGKSGFELLEEITEVPIILVTARGELENKVKGLSLGAEDYIVKPFEMMELIARVGVVLRRQKKDAKVLQLAGVEVNLENRRVVKDGQELSLTPQEFNLLEVMIRNKNIALSRDKLLELAWGYDYGGETKTVDVHVRRLRKKLGWESYIQTVSKVGYRLEI